MKCKGCTERHVGCHSTCVAYLEWKRAHEEVLATRNKEKENKYMSQAALKSIKKRQMRHR